MSNHLPAVRVPSWFVNTLYATVFIGGILALAAGADALSDAAIVLTR